MAIAVCASLQRHSPYRSKVRRCRFERVIVNHTVSLASSVPMKSEPSEMAFSKRGAEHSRYTNVGLCITGRTGNSLEKKVCKLLSRNRGVRSNNAALDVTLRSCKTISQLMDIPQRLARSSRTVFVRSPLVVCTARRPSSVTVGSSYGECPTTRGGAAMA